MLIEWIMCNERIPYFIEQTISSALHNANWQLGKSRLKHLTKILWKFAQTAGCVYKEERTTYLIVIEI